MNYKVTYNSDLMTCQFVRISDNAILFSNDNEDNVIEFANNSGRDFFIE